MNKILIVVDMQNDFIDGSLGSKEAQNILLPAWVKIREYGLNKDVILFTQDTHYDNYLETNEGKHLPIKHCIVGTDGYNIKPELIQALDGISEYYCLSKESFGYTDWKNVFNDLKLSTKNLEIELIGLCTDICVVSNALILKALYPEAIIKVDSKCCAGVTPENHEAALEVMRSCQIEVL